MTDVYTPDISDSLILNILQDDFPLAERPYQILSEKAGITETEFLERISNLSSLGILRSISPVLESKKLGMMAATLVAMHIPPEKIQKIAAMVNSYPQVTHNFIRDHYYSLWFTLIGKDHAALQVLLSEIIEKTGIAESDVLNLTSVKKYKANVRFLFKVKEES